MATMKLEFPMLTLAETMKYNITQSGFTMTESGLDSDDCLTIYEEWLGLSQNMADRLCTQSTNFTFSNVMQTCVALTNTYLYLNGFNSYYYTEFMSVSELTID